MPTETSPLETTAAPSIRSVQWFRTRLLDQALQGQRDKALLARALALPEVQIIAQTRSVVDPDAIYAAREKLRQECATRFKQKLMRIYQENLDTGLYSPLPDAMAKRSLKNTVLGCLDDASLASEQYSSAQNMTDRVAALAVLTDHEGPEKTAAFEDFYARFKSYPLVIDKWFSLQALGVNDNTMSNIRTLAAHKDFTLKNPNRARSLYGAFAINNPVKFHAKDGSGYTLLKEAVIALNAINPQIAARMLTPLREWRRYTPDRQQRMKSALQEIANLEKISPDVFEIVSKSLKA